MKRIFNIYILLTFIFLLVMFFVGFSANSYALQNGLYSGHYLIFVDNPIQCAPSNPGNIRITNLEDCILYQRVIFIGGNEIIIEEKNCTVTGTAMHCPTVDQVIDFSFAGLDAIVTNKASHGVGIIGENYFIINNSARRNTCEGLDCQIVEQWMGVDFPCFIGPFVCEFEKESVIKWLN